MIDYSITKPILPVLPSGSSDDSPYIIIAVCVSAAVVFAFMALCPHCGNPLKEIAFRARKARARVRGLLRLKAYLDVVVALIFLATALVALAYPYKEMDWGPSIPVQFPFVFFFFPFVLMALSWLAVGVSELPNKTVSHRRGCVRLLPTMAMLSAVFAFGMCWLVSVLVSGPFSPNPGSSSLQSALTNLFIIATDGAIVTLVRSAIGLVHAHGLGVSARQVALIILVVSGTLALLTYVLYGAFRPLEFD
jgi:hypothetical protein